MKLQLAAQPVERLLVKCRLSDVAGTAAGATRVILRSPVRRFTQGYEIDKSQVRKGAWHPPAVIRGRLRPGFFDCCAAETAPFRSGACNHRDQLGGGDAPDRCG